MSWRLVTHRFLRCVHHGLLYLMVHTGQCIEPTRDTLEGKEEEVEVVVEVEEVVEEVAEEEEVVEVEGEMEEIVEVEEEVVEEVEGRWRRRWRRRRWWRRWKVRWRR